MRYEFIKNKKLLASASRIQVPWVKVTIGDYTFGIFDEKTKSWGQNQAGFYSSFSIQYPQYINSLNVNKINGQVNTYTLTITYPITPNDDPNFFEKVFSSVSHTRKIVFTYGDAQAPAYIYKNEEAIITKVTQRFNVSSSVISYTVEAVSAAKLSTDGSVTISSGGTPVKPSDEIKKLFKTNVSLQNTFTGMSINDLDTFIAGDDMEVEIESKQNISVLDYINYLTGCMVPIGSEPGLSKSIYVFNIFDDSITSAAKSVSKDGPYFTVSKVDITRDDSEEAYEIDIGINTSTIVKAFEIESNDNYSIYFNYQSLAHPKLYQRKLNDDGLWEDEYAPISFARENSYTVTKEDEVWWTKATQFPINATIKVLGLLRPATLMQYVKLNVIFPGGKKHLASGLYIVTRQFDEIGEQGYTTTLGLTRIKGDKSLEIEATS